MSELKVQIRENTTAAEQKQEIDDGIDGFWKAYEEDSTKAIESFIFLPPKQSTK